MTRPLCTCLAVIALCGCGGRDRAPISDESEIVEAPSDDGGVVADEPAARADGRADARRDRSGRRRDGRGEDSTGDNGRLREFRDTLLRADDTAWRRLDQNYTALKSVIDQLAVGGMDYQDYVDQLQSGDADTRANGMCGVAASRSPAAADHLTAALTREPDLFNRTIAVWCLRATGRDAQVDRALCDYLDASPDIDFGRYAGEDGKVRQFRSPFPLAAFEAFKALAAIRGRRDMLNGEGWRLFAERAGRHQQLQPLSAIDLERLKGGRSAPRTNPEANARRWIEEMRE